LAPKDSHIPKNIMGKIVIARRGMDSKIDDMYIDPKAADT
jgi:hypothetical protein